MLGFSRAWADGPLYGTILIVAFFATTIACGGRSTQREEREADATGPRLYVLNFGSGDISGFDVDASGALSSLAGSPFPLKGLPRGAAVAPNRKTLYVIEGARIASYAIDAATGALKLVGETESDSSVEAIAVSPSGTVVYAAHCTDNGGSISVLPIEGDNELGRPPSQSIPTTLCINGIAVDPMGRFLYVSSQYGYQGALEGFSIDRKSGTLTPIAGSPFASFLATAIAIDPEGKHVYVCDQDALVRSYDVDAPTGELVALRFKAPTGANPFSVAIDHEGHRLLVGNWSGGSVSSYVLDPSSGLPSEAPGSPYPAGDSPHVLAIDASSRFVYINNQGSPTIEVLAIGNAGELSPMAGSPFAVGALPSAAVVVP